MPPTLIYLARGRLQRPRANLVQTLHTVEALTEAGAPTRLYLPPVPSRFDLPAFLADMGIRHPIDLVGTVLLHSNARGWPFLLLERARLRRARAVYTRVPDFSRQMSLLGIPHVLEVHDTDALIAEHGHWLGAALQRGTVRGLTVISEAGKAALIAAGLGDQRIAVLPSGVDLQAFGAVAPLGEADFRTPHGMYVGRISRDRGLGILEAIARHGHRVTLVGPADDTAPSIPTLTQSPAVAHAAVPDVLAQGNVALMPYQSDLQHAATISPIKLFEAMAAGRLVVASDLPAIREVIRDGVNGLLVPPDQPQAWIAAMDRIRSDPAKAARMADAARSDAQQYGWGARARRILDFLDSLDSDS